MLHLPKEVSLRALRIRLGEAGQTNLAWHGTSAYQGWSEIAELRGDVRVPPGVDLWLDVNEEGSTNLAFLKHLTNAAIRIPASATQK